MFMAPSKALQAAAITEGSSRPITQVTHGGWKAPSNIANTGICEVDTEASSSLARKSALKPLPAVLDGMAKAEALAFASRLFGAAKAGGAVWGAA